MISVIMTGQLSVDNTAGAETSRCRDTCVTRDDHSADNEPSSAAPMTTVIMIRVGNDQICVIITAGKGDDHSDDSCGR